MPRSKRITPDQLLDAAASVLPRLGFDKSTIADLAAAAGISKGAFYLCFSSKEALLDALIRREMTILLGRWCALVEADAAGGLIGVQLKLALECVFAHPLLLAFVRQDVGTFGNYLRRAAPPSAASADHKREFISSLQTAGLVRTDLSAEQIAQWLRALTLGFLQLNEAHGDRGERLHSLATLVDAALAPVGVDQAADAPRARSTQAKALLREWLAARLANRWSGSPNND